MFAGIILTLTALLSGGTALAAQGTLPGDFLYPIKVHVNEEVRSVLTFDTESKAQWETQRAERRASEAAELADQNELSEEIATDVSKRIQKHLEKAESLTAKLEEKGNFEAATQAQIRMEVLLKTQQRIFSDLRDRDETATESTDSEREERSRTEDADKITDQPEIKLNSVERILDTIEYKSEVQERIRIDFSEKMEEKTDDFQMQAALRAKKVTEERLVTTKEAINSFIRKNGPHRAAQAELSAAIEVKNQADRNVSAENYVVAFRLYSETQIMLERAKALLRTKIIIDTSIENKVDINLDVNKDEHREPQNQNDEDSQRTSKSETSRRDSEEETKNTLEETIRNSVRIDL